MPVKVHAWNLLVFAFIVCNSCTNDAAQFDKTLRNYHYIYEGVIDNYSVGPDFHSKKEVVMELWFSKHDFIHGYWKEKGSDYKHYLLGSFASLKTIYGADAKRKQKEDARRYGYGMTWFKEMSGKNAKYRIRLTEYSDEHFSNYTDNAFYVFNFEDGRLQGSYYSYIATVVGDGKESWSTSFSTLFYLKRID